MDFQLDQFLGEQVEVTHCVGTGELFLMMEEAKKCFRTCDELLVGDTH